MYWLNYLDRNAIALAKLDNVDKDLGLTATRAFSAPDQLCGEISG